MRVSGIAAFACGLVLIVGCASEPAFQQDRKDVEGPDVEVVTDRGQDDDTSHLEDVPSDLGAHDPGTTIPDAPADPGTTVPDGPSDPDVVADLETVAVDPNDASEDAADDVADDIPPADTGPNPLATDQTIVRPSVFRGASGNQTFSLRPLGARVRGTSTGGSFVLATGLPATK